MRRNTAGESRSISFGATSTDSTSRKASPVASQAATRRTRPRPSSSSTIGSTIGGRRRWVKTDNLGALPAEAW
jgi:hypothetical protein